MSQIFEPKTLSGTPWKEWTRLALGMGRRLGPLWWMASLSPLGVALVVGFQMDGRAGGGNTIWIMSAFMPAFGYALSCGLQRALDRARRGEPARFITDFTAGIDDVLFRRWGRTKALITMSILLGIMGLVVLILWGEPRPADATPPSPFHHAYALLFAGLATIFMFRMRGPLTEFVYYLENWRGADKETAKSLADMAGQKNAEFRPRMNLVSSIPVWIWIILSINGLHIIAIGAISVHFLWLTAMDYIVYREVFEDGAGLEEMKRVESLQLATGRAGF